MKSINNSNDKRLLEDFSQALRSHIRFEERAYFPHLEENLSDEKMKEIGKHLNEIHQKENDSYQDEFWK